MVARLEQTLTITLQKKNWCEVRDLVVGVPVHTQLFVGLFDSFTQLPKRKALVKEINMEKHINVQNYLSRPVGVC